MKTCGLTILQKYMDNELDNKDLAVFNKHIESCAVCKKNLELLQKEEELLDNLAGEALSPDFTSKVMLGLQNTQIQKKPGMVPQLLVCLFLISLIIAVYTIMPDYNLKIMTDIFTDFLMIALRTAKIFFSSILNNDFTRAFINPLFSIFKKNILGIALKVTVIESVVILFAGILWMLRRAKTNTGKIKVF